MKRLLFLLLILVLSGCAALNLAPVQPSDPAISQPTATVEAASDALPEPTLGEEDAAAAEPEPTSAPTDPLPQPETGLQPEGPAPISGTAGIAILRPGQLSRVASPFRIAAYLSDPAIDRATITLYGEDGREIVSFVKRTLLYGNETSGNLVYDLEFETEALAEAGRLEIKTFDGYGRLTALNTVNLILLSMGSTDRNYALEDGERIELQIPFPTTTEINGSPLLISGLVRLTPPPDNGDPEPLLVQLINQAGTIVGESTAPVILTPGSTYGQFVAEIHFQVDSATPVLLTIGIREGRIMGLTYVKTFPLNLNP